SLGAQLGEGGADVVGHQVELVAGLPVRRMNRELGRRQGEDEPAPARVDRGQAEHVREERADLLRLRREHYGVHPIDHVSILRPEARRRPLTATILLLMPGWIV